MGAEECNGRTVAGQGFRVTTTLAWKTRLFVAELIVPQGVQVGQEL